MGEEDCTVSIGHTRECPYMSSRRDCDGDWDNYCCSSGDYSCPYKHNVRDCDGDTITMCRM